MKAEDDESRKSAAPQTVASEADSRASAPSSKESASLAETSKYFVTSIEQARKRAFDLAKETSRRSGLALKEMDALDNNSDHVTAFRASREFRLLKERVCTAEKNVLIERDRYSRLLARFTELSGRQADDVKRIQSLQNALSDYQRINDTLARKLDEQGNTLEQLVMSIRRARSEFLNVHDPDSELTQRETEGELLEAKPDSHLQSSIQVTAEFEDIWSDSADDAVDTYPLARRKST